MAALCTLSPSVCRPLHHLWQPSVHRFPVCRPLHLLCQPSVHLLSVLLQAPTPPLCPSAGPYTSSLSFCRPLHLLRPQHATQGDCGGAAGRAAVAARRHGAGRDLPHRNGRHVGGRECREQGVALHGWARCSIMAGLGCKASALVSLSGTNWSEGARMHPCPDCPAWTCDASSPEGSHQFLAASRPPVHS